MRVWRLTSGSMPGRARAKRSPFMCPSAPRSAWTSSLTANGSACPDAASATRMSDGAARLVGLGAVGPGLGQRREGARHRDHLGRGRRRGSGGPDTPARPASGGPAPPPPPGGSRAAGPAGRRPGTGAARSPRASSPRSESGRAHHPRRDVTHADVVQQRRRGDLRGGPRRSRRRQDHARRHHRARERVAVADRVRAWRPPAPRRGEGATVAASTTRRTADRTSSARKR